VNCATRGRISRTCSYAGRCSHWTEDGRIERRYTPVIASNARVWQADDPRRARRIARLIVDGLRA